MSKLDNLIADLAKGVRELPEGMDKGWQYESKQAIKALILELIGPDYPTNPEMPGATPHEEAHNCEKNALRQKVEEL